MAKLHRFDAVIVDDLGSYVEQSAAEIDVLFSFFSERYERQRTVIVTSNLVFSQWDKIFKNPMTAQAVVDRLVHRAIVIEFTGESFRAKAAKQRQAA